MLRLTWIGGESGEHDWVSRESRGVGTVPVLTHAWVRLFDCMAAAEMGLEILYKLLLNVGSTPSVAQGFYRQFLLSLIQVRP